MSRTALAIALVLAAVLPLAGQDEPMPVDPTGALLRLETAFLDPPATGLLITNVGPESQAAEAGIEAGDVLVSYGGRAVTDLDALNRAKEDLAGEETVELTLTGPGGERTVTLRPGPIGVNCQPVAKGVPAASLPTPTVTGFDFTQLAKGPFDDWYAFSLDGEEKVGFEHARLALTLGKLVLRREVAFDGGEQFGVNHFDVTAIAVAGPPPDVFAVKFASPPSDFLASGRALPGSRWLDRRFGAETVLTHPSDLPRIPTYLVESLAAFLPREPGACFRFRPITEGTGLAGIRSALVAVGEEEVRAGGEVARAFRVEWRLLSGAVAGTYWLDGPGHALLVDYGGAMAWRTTREKALEGLPPSIRPR
ncbi:MAG: PDZ domain-containing protein [Planctomycetes bacterium]|nr:PDZ domain-containing protein [Planctomycetota bacterium]